MKKRVVNHFLFGFEGQFAVASRFYTFLRKTGQNVVFWILTGYMLLFFLLVRNFFVLICESKNVCGLIWPSSSSDLKLPTLLLLVVQTCNTVALILV